MTNRSKVIQLRVTEEEQKRFKAACASEGLGLSEWIRKRCEGLTKPPVALQGHSEGVRPVTSGTYVIPTTGNAKQEAVRPVTPGKHGRGAPGASLCSRTGFPVEACLCPQCKKLK